MATDSTHIPQAGTMSGDNHADHGAEIVQLAQADTSAGNANVSEVKVELPNGQNIVRIRVTPGEVLDLPFDGDLSARFGDQGNLAIKLGDRTIILEGYASANQEHGVTLKDASGDEIDVASVVAQTDPNLDIQTAAGSAAGAAGTPGSGFFAAFSGGNGLGGLGEIGVLGGTDLQYSVPQPDSRILIAGNQADAGPAAPGGIVHGEIVTEIPEGEGNGRPGQISGSFNGAFEDWQPNQHLGDHQTAPAQLVIDFTPSTNEVITNIVITNIPAGVEIYVGDPKVLVATGDGSNSVTIDAADLGHIFIKPGANSGSDLTIDFEAHITNPTTGQTTVLTDHVPVVVDAVADKPVEVVAGHADANGDGFVTPGEKVTITVSATFSDFKDGSESHYILVKLPEGWTAPEGSTFVTIGDADTAHTVFGVEPGQYIQLPVDNASIDPETGVGSASLTLTAPTLTGAENNSVFEVVAKSEDHESSGDAKGLDGNNVSYTTGQDSFHVEVAPVVDVTASDQTVTIHVGCENNNPSGNPFVGDSLQEGVALDPSKVAGNLPHPATLTYEADVSGTFITNGGSFQSVIGWYVINPDGSMGEGHVLWSNSGTAGSSTVDLGNLPAGSQIGFFLIPDGYAANGGTVPSTIYFFEGRAYADADHQTLIKSSTYGTGPENPTWFTNPTAENPNLDGAQHGIQGVTKDADGYLYVGFEDLSGGDNDFNDVVFKVNLGEGNKVVTDPTVLHPSFNVSDVDSADLTKAVVTFTLGNGDTVKYDTAYAIANGLTVTRDGDKFTISGTASKDVYDHLLDSFEITVGHTGHGSDYWNIDTSDRGVTVEVTDHSGLTSNPDSTTIHVGVEQDGKPCITVTDAAAVAEPTDASGQTYAVFTIKLSDASINPVTVHYSTKGGTATDGTDYQHIEGDITFPPGQTEITIKVPINADDVSEGTEKFTLELSNPVNGDIQHGSGTGTITDSNPLPTISINDVSVTEPALASGPNGTTLLTFTVTLTGTSDTAIHVNYSSANGTALSGSDYDAVSGQLTFQPGETSKTITVVVHGDNVLETTPENFNINLDIVEKDRASGEKLTGTGTILDNESAPVAVNDAYSTKEDSVLTISDATKGVRANDTDADNANSELTITLGTGPAHGTVTMNADGTFVYTPNSGYSGTDSFKYWVTDPSGLKSEGTVNVTVTPVNHAPVANNDSYTTNQGTSLHVGGAGILANDSDPDGDLLSAILVTGPAHGTLTLNADGTFTYVPANGWSGTDTFTYKVNDGHAAGNGDNQHGDSNVATVTINVASTNHAPVAVDDSYTVKKDTVLNTTTGNGVLKNDSDADGDKLSLTTTGTFTTEKGGTLIINADGTFKYTPPAGFVGKDSFTYQAYDGHGGMSNTAKVTIDVTTSLPTAQNDTATVNSGGGNYNLMLVIDTSDSMNEQSGINGLTRLQLEKQAINQMLDSLATNGGTVKIQIVDFNSSSTISGIFTSVSAAKAYVNGLTAHDNTNYDSAVSKAEKSTLFDNTPAGTTNLVYFLSDGKPNEPWNSAGLNQSELSDWQDFLNTHNATATSVGVGKGDIDVDQLKGISSSGNAIVVTDPNALSGTLAGTLPGAVSGNVLINDNFGGDGGSGVYQLKLAYNGQTVTFDANSIIGGHVLAKTGHTITVDTGLGGKLTFNFDTGDYTYVPPSVSTDKSETFNYVIKDGDGDTSSANLTINIHATDHVTVPYTPDHHHAIDIPGGWFDDGSHKVDGVIYYNTEGDKNWFGKDDTLVGSSNQHNWIEGLGGDDTLKAGKLGDVLIGGVGHDTYVGGAGNDTFVIDRADLYNDNNKLISGSIVDGKGGYNRLTFDFDLDTTKLNNGSTKTLSHLDVLDMNDSKNEILTLSKSSVTAMANHDNTLFVQANTGDQVKLTASDNWTNHGTSVGSDGHNYVHYTSGTGANTVHVYIDEHATVQTV